MHVSLLASLDPQCRQDAAELLSGTHPSSVVVVHDLLDGGVVLRRIYRQGELAEGVRTQLEHGCLSCTVRLDVVPTVNRLIREGVGHAVLALPPGVELDMVVEALFAGVEEEFSIDNAALALDPAELEDQLWDRRGLGELGLSGNRKDDRTPGEFVIAALAQADTVLPAASLVNSLSDGPNREGEAGLELLAELAPHATVAWHNSEITPGCFDWSEAIGRQRPGVVLHAPQQTHRPGRHPAFTTVHHRLSRPLHPERFREILPELAAGSCWIRGRLWIASNPAQRIAIHGIGPRLWLENTGAWQQGAPWPSSPASGEQPGSVLALTGRSDQVVEGEVLQLLERAQLRPSEHGNEPEYFNDPFGLNASK